MVIKFLTAMLRLTAIVRVKELLESYRVIRAILENPAEKQLTTRIPRKIPAGKTISRVEAPRGELLLC